jgi:hypothetical protein
MRTVEKHQPTPKCMGCNRRTNYAFCDECAPPNEVFAMPPSNDLSDLVCGASHRRWNGVPYPRINQNDRLFPPR